LSIHPLHDALGTVRLLRRSLLEKQRFKGWSGPTRLFSGGIALVASVFLHFQWFPADNLGTTMVWGSVFLAAMILNLGALIYWFLHDEAVDRDPQRLRPILDVIPPLAVGALFTFVLIWGRNFDPLYGTWMCMFGLTNLASRYVLPPAISLVGVFYILSGSLCLLLPGIGFTQTPLAMGLVFCIGECTGGAVLHLDDRRYAATLREFRQEHPSSEEADT